MANTVKTLLKSVRQYKKPSIITPVFMLLEAFCECLIPFFMSQMINEAALSSGDLWHIGKYRNREGNYSVSACGTSFFKVFCIGPRIV